MRLIFWNVDTQIDFIEPSGKLYVPGAEDIKPILERITRLAGEKLLIVVNTADFHHNDSIEISDNPDFMSTFPAHCLAGTKGAESSRILKRIFGTDIRPQNDPNTILLNEYLDLVYADKWNDGEAQKKRKELDDIYQGNEPELTKADLYIENRLWELEIEENQ